jgi:hypothetical protein
MQSRPAYFEMLQDAQVALEKKINHLSIFFLDLDLDDDFFNIQHPVVSWWHGCCLSVLKAMISPHVKDFFH